MHVVEKTYKFYYSYDKRGNRISETQKKDTQTYVYDATNRMVSGTNTKGDTSAYTYNGLGLRVNNTVTSHAGKVYSRDYVIDYTSPENDDLYVYAMGNGSLEYEQKHVYVDSERIEQYTERGSGSWERLLYVHEDVMGNTYYYTKTNGGTFADLEYDAWGMPQSPNKLVNNDHGNYVFATFTGHIYDTTLDIYFAEARFYDANNRTWMSVDAAKDGNNWYQYCDSNPTTYWDPTGMSWWSDFTDGLKEGWEKTKERAQNKVNDILGGLGNFASKIKTAASDFANTTRSYFNKLKCDVGQWWSVNKTAVISVVAGTTVIVGLGVLSAFTGGAAGAIAGAALSGALAGGASGAAFGAIGGLFKGEGIGGVLRGAATGFGSGSIFGAITGTLTAGFNVATGITTVTNKPHGTLLHKLASNMEAGKMVASGQYTRVALNQKLKTVGLVGTKQPDVMGIAADGTSKLVEVVSLKQSVTSITKKMGTMLTDNPGATGKIVTWVREVGKIIYKK